ncbi:MAG: FimB/Mfa2 family fimbrial subunit [Tannerellaceae bacterium]|jgi:hypothetical protein|nr:FimB/Mfa2 family fimbrial subunit [Tannerellaceae bacterium]
MKKTFPSTFLLSLGFLFSSCEQPFIESQKSEVSVITRSNPDETCDLFPIQVYAFYPDGECVDHQILESADDSLFFTLPPENYTFYALAGVSADRYTLPNVSTASTFYPLELKDQTTGHAEIGTARADIVVSNGEKGSLELVITRVVAKIDASVFDLPENITNVVMSFNPVETQLLLDGTFDEDPEKKELCFTLTEKNPGEWHTTDSVFVFPSKANITIGILLTEAEGKKRKYSYNASFKIKANYKYEINATYKAGSPDLSGVIKGTDWDGEEEYAFDFGEGESASAGSESSGSESSYVAGGFYNEDCYILHVEEITEGRAILTLLSPSSSSGMYPDNLKENIGKLDAGGFSDWQMFSEEDARMVNQLCNEGLEEMNNLLDSHDVPTFQSSEKYLYEKDGTIKAFALTGTFKSEIAVPSKRYYIRGVKKIIVSIP